MKRKKSVSWWDMYASSMAAATTAFRMGETMLAANAVIGSRVQTMHAAACDPLAGDYAELGRMVPEKVDAFSKAGASMFKDFEAIQRESMAQLQHMTKLAMSGRVLSLGDVAALGARSARITERATGAGGRALVPVHAAATGNAKRLKKASG